MAHPKRPRGPGAYYPDGHDAGWQVLRLRSAFLRAVEEACPECLAEYEALAHGALSEALTGTAVHDWAGRYYLSAPWLISAARAGIQVAQVSDKPARPVLHIVFQTPGSAELHEELARFSYPPLTEAELLTPPKRKKPRVWHPYTGIEPPSEYRERFIQELDEHIAIVIDALEHSPDVSKARLVDARTREAVLHAAEWQTNGGTTGGDYRSILDVLARIHLEPRPGLRTAQSQLLQNA